jgi:hypothetical protein
MTTARSGLDYTPHRADDLPAYLVIVIVGHIVVPAVLWIKPLFAGRVAATGDYPIHLHRIARVAAAGEGAVVGFSGYCAHGFDENAPSDIPPVYS